MDKTLIHYDSLVLLLKKCFHCKMNKSNIIISDRVLMVHCVIESGHAITHVTEVYCRMNDVPAKLILV